MFDLALTILNTFLTGSNSASSPGSQKTFVYISAEDIFGPLVPREYITSKRAAERDIAAACLENAAAGVRAVSLRPGKSVCNPCLAQQTDTNILRIMYYRLDVPSTLATAYNTHRHSPISLCENPSIPPEQQQWTDPHTRLRPTNYRFYNPHLSKGIVRRSRRT